MSGTFTILDGHYAIVRLHADDAIPHWAHGAFLSITRTSDELSIVCEEGNVPDVIADRGWRCLKLAGPMPLDQTGVAAAFTRLLAAAGVPLFAAICELPEYYVTRAEDEILRTKGAEIAAAFGPNVRIAELGSGSARKTRHLIDAILNRQASLDFFPIDVDAGILASSSREL